MDHREIKSAAHYLVIGEIAHIPTVDNASSCGMLVDFATMQQVQARSLTEVPINHIWLRTSDDPATALRVRITGLFSVATQRTGVLQGETFQPVVNDEGAFYTLFMPAPALLAHLDQAARHANIDAIFSPSTFQINLSYHLQVARLQTSQVNDLLSRLSQLQISVAKIVGQIQAQQSSALGAYANPYLSQFTLYNPTPNTFAITTLLEQYNSRIALARIPPAILALLILALIVFFIGLIVTLLIERQGEANAMLSSRGASTRQIFWSLLF